MPGGVADWELGRVKVLPKKGDLSDTNNWRGICLLEVSYKIIGNVILARMNAISECIDHEAQCGFRPFRGCGDAIFNLRMAIKKRREHNLETWVLLLDLVKAFDRVPRELLWLLLPRLGVPAKLVSVLKALFTDVKCKLDYEGEFALIKSVIRVKQGDLLGPVLFSYHMAAVMIAWRARFKGTTPTFCTKFDDVLSGRASDTAVQVAPPPTDRPRRNPCRNRRPPPPTSGTLQYVRSCQSAAAQLKHAPDHPDHLPAPSPGGKADCNSAFTPDALELAATTSESFPFTDTEYADDTGVLFCSRSELEFWTPQLYQCFADFGLEVHARAPDGKKDKTEILFCAAPPRFYSDFPRTADPKAGDRSHRETRHETGCFNYREFVRKDGTKADLSRVVLASAVTVTNPADGLTHITNPIGSSIPIVHRFKYLGSWITTDGRDDVDVDERLKSAAQQFGHLKKCVFYTTEVSNAAKHAVYTGLVLNVLLYGSESWSLSEVLLSRIHRFHMDRVRTMCRVNRWHTRHRHIRNEYLLDRLHLQPVRSYITHRQLRWLGHVARMPPQRLPRKLLTCWVPSARPVGRPLMTYAETVRKALCTAGIELGSWYEMAQDRSLWRAALRHLTSPGKTKPSGPTSGSTSSSPSVSVRPFPAPPRPSTQPQLRRRRRVHLRLHHRQQRPSTPYTGPPCTGSLVTGVRCGFCLSCKQRQAWFLAQLAPQQPQLPSHPALHFVPASLATTLSTA